MSRIFTREELFSLGLPDEGYADDEGAVLATVLSDEVVGKHRWSEVHELVFRVAGQEETAWRVQYNRGLTEQQEERPWEYEPTVTAALVHEVERTVKVWVEVDATPTPAKEPAR